ncbi:solute carrier family 41 member 3-like [Oppia nitens]|uniref:solute carrier family 41 member 3-like n=1 Tax=Oppia nitens TaxID=1686743 RepID=UPI0023DC66F5|nr:solute carrier family 41 member 3-like [Oppia nitens]
MNYPTNNSLNHNINDNNNNNIINTNNNTHRTHSTRRRVSESIYRPNFYRQRSHSCSAGYYGHEIDGINDKEDVISDGETDITISVIRRKSDGFALKHEANGAVNNGFIVDDIQSSQLPTCPCTGQICPNGCIGPLGPLDEVVVAAKSGAPTIIQNNGLNKSELIISVPIHSTESVINTKTFIDVDDDDNDDKHHGDEEPRMQSTWTVLKQMIIPFLIAGIGSVGAGIVLNNVQHTQAFMAIPQLIIMVPSFIGLIGNIETTLASRLSTHSNLGTLDVFSRLRSMVLANSCVVICQASTVGLFAAFASLAISYIKSSNFSAVSMGHLILILCSSSVSTSIVANIILATAITIIIIGARKININPDNIATPVAASMGDVCTISILAVISDFMYKQTISGRLWIPVLILALLLLLAPITGYIARQNRYTKSVIVTGWVPILGAVIIEQPGGLVMGDAFDKYDVMSTFQPLVNGIGSNLVGIQTSRLSTYLHQTAPKGKLPKSNSRACVQPFAPFIGNGVHSRMARLLLAITVPAHLFYLGIIYAWKNNFTFTAAFVGSYLIAVMAQITILLYLAYVSVLWAWKRHINPDNSAIPFTSALADVLGNCLMAGAFAFLHSINDPNAVIPVVADLSAANSSSTINSINHIMNTTQTLLSR